MIKSIGVFCGSSVGAKSVYTTEAATLGKLMAMNDIELIYGGGNVGLMGVIADAVIENKGKSVGVITNFLKDKELGHPGITKMEVVESMSERKNLITHLSDAFIAMPGGFGTLDEVMEVLTYFQLGISEKPVGFLNADGYFDDLIRFLDHATNEKFVKIQHRQNIVIGNSAEEILEKILNFKLVHVEEKWIDNLKTKNHY